MSESEKAANIEEQVERFRSEMDSLESLVSVLDPLNFVGQEEFKIPVGNYMALVVCDNCGEEVFLLIRKSIPVPRELPAERCPTCRVEGHIYRPMTEKEMFDEARRRYGF